MNSDASFSDVTRPARVRKKRGMSPHIGRSVQRLEDFRFLTGRGRYLADIDCPGALWGHVLRSPHAHALIKRIDAAAAKRCAGVHGVYTAADLAGLGPMPCLAAVSPLIVPPRHALAVDRVRHVGDPVAFVVADSAEIAREAAELVEIDYEALPSVVDGRAALADGAPSLWDQAPRNTAFHIQKGDAAAVAQAMKDAAHIVEIDVMNNRVVIVPIEQRAGIARYDAATDTFDLELTGQGVHGIRRQLAEFVFKMPPERIRLHAPDVGGGFGTKNFLYPEWILLLWAARKLGRPVRWEADRAEEFVSSAQGRDIAATARLALDKDGRFLALDIAMVANHGAYLSGNGPGAAAVAASTAHGGVYDIPAIAADVRGAFTNTVPVDAYRGAGKPEANYIVERCIEAAARKLGRDPASLRRQNLIASFPHKTAMGMNIDSGGFVDNLDRAVLRGELAAFEARRAEAKARGKLRGHRRRLLPRDLARRAQRRRRGPLRERRHGHGRGRHRVERPGPRDRLRPDRGRPARRADGRDPLRAGRHARGEERCRPWRRALDAHGRRRGGEGDRCDPCESAAARGPSSAGVRRRARLRRR